MKTNNEIAQAWIAYHTCSDMSFFWATEDLLEYSTSESEADSEKAWEIIKIIFHNAKTDFMLSILAAGPMEDLLSIHGDKFISKVEEETLKYPRFKEILKSMYRHGMNDSVWDRVQNLIK